MTAVPSYIRDMERLGALQTIIDDDRIHNVKRIWKHDGAGNWSSEIFTGVIDLGGAVLSGGNTMTTVTK
jgi:hypothetical protein